jgi:hypothetical protein
MTRILGEERDWMSAMAVLARQLGYLDLLESD